jgi:2'-5' RNA ligase
MANRWESRAEPRPGQGKLYWHILFKGHPQVQAIASIGQEKLSGFPGLHFTPRQWLHITTFVPGLVTDFTSSGIVDMVDHARRLLAALPPITISLGRILYHPEAIVLKVEPYGALNPVFKAMRGATEMVMSGTKVGEQEPWVPHVTLAYSTADQPAGPIIAALGSELPPCEVTIRSVSLVVQEGAERLWNWHTLAEAHLAYPELGGSRSGAGQI